ncbi:response regulator [Myxococcus sp. K15C18031901]|uniref:response regulator n=1 Tax=Myxococcus dinghuensis TaxID=2906761 RepID=UPI0020A74006|nr:response regulator [Myxococcus dinghuensis]MCP3101197.1 response regulator [Myxococcus dinghuensis]
MTPPNCVLVVDDDPDILLAFTDILELEGHEAVTARGARAAMALLEQGLRPSVILLDLVMPGMDGWALRDQLLADAELASIPVVVVSGQGVSPREASSRRVSGALRKPVELEQLLGMVARHSAAGGDPLTRYA